MKNHIPPILILLGLLSLSIIPAISASKPQECDSTLYCCPKFQYTLIASTEVTRLTNLEADLIVPAAPENGKDSPIWGIFPFIEPAIEKNNPRYGILQPVLEWNYQHQTHQWTITPWYEDGNYAKLCGNQNQDPSYCTCTDKQKSLGNPATTKLYRIDVPQCHKMCEPKHGQRITANPGDTIHFTITKTGNAWITTALNRKTNQRTSFQTTCIQHNDKLKIGFALENSVSALIKKNDFIGSTLPKDITFTNIKFTGDTGIIQLKPTIEPAAKACFPWLEAQITNSWVVGNTNSVTFITQPKKQQEL